MIVEVRIVDLTPPPRGGEREHTYVWGRDEHTVAEYVHLVWYIRRAGRGELSSLLNSVVRRVQ